MWVSRTLDKVDKTMAEIQEQTQIANEIQEVISNGPLPVDLDEVRYSLTDTLLWSECSPVAYRTS